MTTREAFEEWDQSGDYSDWKNFDGLSRHEQFFLCWQAATDAALERAAEEVEKIDKENWFAWQCAFSKHAAEAIRALKERP